MAGTEHTQGPEAKSTWARVRELAFDLAECAQEEATYEAVDAITEALQLLMKQLDQDAQDATNRGLKRLSEIVQVRAVSNDAVAVLSDIVAALREDAPGTPLNNHKYDQLGIRAYAVIDRAKAEAQE